MEVKSLKKHWLIILGTVLGALGGFLYWKFVGCESGGCPITASPVNSVIWGSVTGALLLSTFKKKEEKNE